jgi:hypothetical protein
VALSITAFFGSSVGLASSAGLKSENRPVGGGGNGNSIGCDVFAAFCQMKMAIAIKPKTKTEVIRRVTIAVRQGY